MTLFRYVMANYDHMGKHHWHPEFKHLDYYDPPRKLAKYRKPRKGHSPLERGPKRVKKAVAPLDEIKPFSYFS